MDKGRYVPAGINIRKKGNTSGKRELNRGTSKETDLTPKREGWGVRREMSHVSASWKAPDFQMTGQA